ncbi:MAG: hypothetical protein C0519_15690 [Hyphomicrobium sp.]|jgi:uncharacterized protein (DUF302 family)|nr:hypothetical protein [Hyphomicrobium sp.]MBY0225210.1 DUF302 domain-containing protein [Hyphomicrobium sp.]
MSYYFNKVLLMSFDDVVTLTAEKLKEQGFGIITEIDVTKTLKSKIGVEFRPYRILGACNPALAHEALKLEDKVGTMLPCNVIVQELAPGRVEVAAINPVASMAAIDNPALLEKAAFVRAKLEKVIESL